MIALACEVNGGLGEITTPGAIVLAALIIAGAWIVGRIIG